MFDFLRNFTTEHRATTEGLKEVGRWLLLFVVSWLITETLAQTAVFPETYNFYVFGLVYGIPVRGTVVLALTLLGRLVDKYQHETHKALPEDERKTGWLGIKGLTGF